MSELQEIRELQEAHRGLTSRSGGAELGSALGSGTEALRARAGALNGRVEAAEALQKPHLTAAQRLHTATKL